MSSLTIRPNLWYNILLAFQRLKSMETKLDYEE
jgi:hypothetical protein